MARPRSRPDASRCSIDKAQQSFSKHRRNPGVKDRGPGSYQNLEPGMILDLLNKAITPLSRGDSWSVSCQSLVAEVSLLRQVSGAQLGTSDGSNGSGPAARSPASTGRYAAHSGRTPLKPASRGLAIDGRDACRPEAVLADRLLACTTASVMLCDSLNDVSPTRGTRSMRPLLFAFSLVMGAIAACLMGGLWFIAPGLFGIDGTIAFFWPVFVIFIGGPLALLVAVGVGRYLFRLLVKIQDRVHRRATAMTLVLALPLAVSLAMGWFILTFGDVNPRWSEQVRLPDGTDVMVLRQAKGNVWAKLESRPDSWFPTEYILDLPRLGAAGAAPQWNSTLRPVLLDRDLSSGNWFVVAEPLGCNAWSAMGKPNPPYYVFVLDDKRWVRTQLPNSFVGRRPNLLLTPWFSGEQKVVLFEAAMARNDAVPFDQRPVIHAKSGCQ